MYGPVTVDVQFKSCVSNMGDLNVYLTLSENQSDLEISSVIDSLTNILIFLAIAETVVIQPLLETLSIS